MIPKFDNVEMGDKDYKQVVRDAIDSLGEDVGLKIDPEDFQTIHLHEVTKCLRQSYYDRTDPLKQEQSSLNKILGGLFRKLKSRATVGDYEFDGIKLKGQADMVVRDVVMIFRSVEVFPENPLPSDILYLNACMWMFDKIEGIITYITRDGKEDSFVATKNQKMFEEVIRRTKVFNDLLKEKKKPIIEPSTECLNCQYYTRCFIKKKEGKSISIPSLFGAKEI